MAIFNSKLLVYQRVIVPIIFLITIFPIPSSKLPWAIFNSKLLVYQRVIVPIIFSHHNMSHHMIPKGHTPSPWSPGASSCHPTRLRLVGVPSYFPSMFQWGKDLYKNSGQLDFTKASGPLLLQRRHKVFT